MTDPVVEKPGQQRTVERPPVFLATPERVSQYLELRTEEVTAQMKSVEGRQQLFRELMQHEEDLRKDHRDFNPEALQAQLEVAGETLTANERYLQEIQAPEKKGIFGRARESVKKFGKAHPIVMSLLVASVVAGGIAGGFYVTGNWELLMAATGLKKIFSAATATGEMVPPTPGTSPLPGGGLFEVPPPTTPPGGLNAPI